MHIASYMAWNMCMSRYCPCTIVSAQLCVYNHWMT